MIDAGDPTGSARDRWARFCRDAPELARTVEDRFAANRHHVIGTVRADGAPRLSGTEVRIEPTGVSLGMMADSRKLADVRRDPRVEIHSAPLEDDLVHGDAKLAGRLLPRDERPEAEPGAGYFELLVERVSVVRVEDEELVITSWDATHGAREQRRR